MNLISNCHQALHLLPTTIRYLCTGKIKEENQMQQKKEENNMLLKLQQKEKNGIEQQGQEDDGQLGGSLNTAGSFQDCSHPPF
ncbi:hypothetical protein KIN20_023711 [Parelaphostrongylus tenuis]|uniref:Uncharacterized protein n=1 Tax=Parelaphostrongylus tenuis TaxID=148309 RepID=A0AAD5QXG5_PARTN|nr:hypothetical protein KIN20_023711 [Parelaphostrongylus tenuis]